MRKLIWAYAAVILVCFESGCAVNTALRDAVNGTFPPIDHVDHQVTAVKASAAELAAFTDAPTLYVSLLSEDLRKILPTAVETTLKTASGAPVNISAAHVLVDLGPQEVIVTITFDMSMPSEKAHAGGTAEVHCTASVEQGALVLRPSGSTLKLSSLSYRGRKSLLEMTSVANALLRSFLANLNGAIAAQRIPLRFQVSRSIDLAETLRQTKGVESSTGTTVGASVSLGSTAVLIDPRAIRVLASAVFLTPDQFAASFTMLEARVKAGRTDPLSSQESAAMAACSDPDAFAQAINTADRTKVAQICQAAREGLAPIKTEHFPTTSAAYKALAESFPKYYDGFMQRAQEIEPGQRVYKDETVVAISRSALAAGLQPILARASASATYVQSIPAQKFNQLITPTTTDLKCTENAAGCDSDFAYDGPPPPEPCRSDCSGSDRKCAFGICVDIPRIDLLCVANKAGCEAANLVKRQKYEADKAIAQVGWLARKEACELSKAVQKSGCELNQAWLNTWASKEIARVEGSAAVPELKVFAAVDGVTLTPDFTTLTVQYRLRADARITAQARITPLNGGHLICAMPANLDLDASAHAEAMSRTVSATERPARRSGDDLLLSYAVSAQRISLRFEPSLAVALFDQNTSKLLLSCPAPALIVASIPGFSTALVGLKIALRIKPDLLDSTQSIDIPGRTFTLTIPRQEIAVKSTVGAAGGIVSVYPEWGQGALLFTARVGKLGALGSP